MIALKKIITEEANKLQTWGAKMVPQVLSTKEKLSVLKILIVDKKQKKQAKLSTILFQIEFDKI